MLMLKRLQVKPCCWPCPGLHFRSEALPVFQAIKSQLPVPLSR
jgi:hypothetical protein